MNIGHKALSAMLILALTGSVTVFGTLAVRAATPGCGAQCISIFSKELGSYTKPGAVESIFDGSANQGQHVVLTQGSNPTTWQDLIPTGGHIVADFYKAGMVSADVNARYGSLKAAQIEYAPDGKPTGLCVGLQQVAYQNEAATLQPCTVPALTVWIIDTADSPATAKAGYFPIVNASTIDFVQPFAMSLSQAEVTNHETPQIYVSRLQFRGSDKTLDDGQLWGAHFGPLSP